METRFILRDCLEIGNRSNIPSMRLMVIGAHQRAVPGVAMPQTSFRKLKKKRCVRTFKSVTVISITEEILQQCMTLMLILFNTKQDSLIKNKKIYI